MSQTVIFTSNGEIQELRLPDPNEEVLPGVKWGHHYATFTPSFWASLAWANKMEDRSENHRLGDTLAEEITACLLGGYGIPAEVGLAAFRRLKDRDYYRTHPTPRVDCMKLCHHHWTFTDAKFAIALHLSGQIT